MYKLLAIGIMISSCTFALAADAGRIVFVTGKADLANNPATLDAAVQEGDEIVTGSDGYVYIKTIDNGFFILRPNSRAKVTAYHIDNNNPANNRVKLELKNGVARAISGQGVKASRQNFRFNTPVAAIGVRGTDFIVFTDQQTSRVSVISGGVVMSGFGATCTAEGAGPCEGSASRELFAGQAGLLQVQRGENVPQLLNNPALLPDQNEKPRVDEPVGKVSTAAPLPSTQLNLDPQRELAAEAVRAANTSTPPADNPGKSGGQAIVTAPPVVEVTPPPAPVPEPVPVPQPVPDPVATPAPVPVVPVPEPLPPKPQEIFWGRWSMVAGTMKKPDSFTNQDLDNARFLDGYMIARTKGATLVMPTEGNIAFTLTGSEASMLRGTKETVAKVDSGSLGINFSNRTFTTALVVSDAASTVNVNGRGLVDLKGTMTNDGSSQTTIVGFLSGAHAEEAAYLFRN
ncbi:MAG TPA: FecR family protein, partial [Pseudoduganella sp.]